MARVVSEVLRADRVHLRVADGRATREILVDVSLELGAGELVAVRGPSGSGKTSLLAVLGGLVTPSEGDVSLNGLSIVRLRDHHRTALRRSTIGFVVQELALIPDMSVMENVLLPFVPDGVTSADRAAAQRWLDRLGLGDRGPSLARALSGGEKQRVALARALVRDPAVLLLDEPTAHVDAKTAEELVAELVRLREDGRTLLVASHDPRLLEAAGLDRILELDRGRLSETAQASHSS